MSDIAHLAPRRRPVRFWTLMFGTCAAPIFWLGQLMLGYWVTAVACYGGDHPTTIESDSALRSVLIAFDAVAIIAAVLGLLVSYVCWRNASEVSYNTTMGRARFMAIWGIWSSLCFLLAILLSTISSIAVPLCTR